MKSYGSILSSEIKEFLTIRQASKSKSAYDHDVQILWLFDQYMCDINCRRKDLGEQQVTGWINTLTGKTSSIANKVKYAFRLLLEYLYSKKGIPADGICFGCLDYDCLTGFIDWLEMERGCSISTKNQRLSALLSFSEYAQNRDFEAACVFRSNLLKIPVKKGKKQLRIFFTVPEITILLQLPNEKRGTGCRDKILLSFMYASGARAQEVCDLTVGDIRFNGNKTASITITGKGGFEASWDK